MGGVAGRDAVDAVLGDPLADPPRGEAVVEQVLKGLDVGPRHELGLGHAEGPRPAGRVSRCRVTGMAAVAVRRRRGGMPLEAVVPDASAIHHVVGVGARAVVGLQPAVDAAELGDERRQVLDADADVRAGLEAAAELVGPILQEGARELHGPHALGALAAVAMLQVGLVERFGDDEVGPPVDALDRVGHAVVPEHVGERRLDLHDRAHERDGHLGAPRLGDDDVLVVAAGRADGSGQARVRVRRDLVRRAVVRRAVVRRRAVMRRGVVRRARLGVGLGLGLRRGVGEALAQRGEPLAPHVGAGDLVGRAAARGMDELADRGRDPLLEGGGLDPQAIGDLVGGQARLRVVHAALGDPLADAPARQPDVELALEMGDIRAVHVVLDEAERAPVLVGRSVRGARLGLQRDDAGAQLGPQAIELRGVGGELGLELVERRRRRASRLRDRLLDPADHGHEAREALREPGQVRGGERAAAAKVGRALQQRGDDVALADVELVERGQQPVGAQLGGHGAQSSLLAATGAPSRSSRSLSSKSSSSPSTGSSSSIGSPSSEGS